MLLETLRGVSDSVILKLDPNSMETVKDTNEEKHCMAEVEVFPVENPDVRLGQFYVISILNKESGIVRFEVLEGEIVFTPTPEPTAIPTNTPTSAPIRPTT